MGRIPGAPVCDCCNNVTYLIRSTVPFGHGKFWSLPFHVVLRPGKIDQF